MTTARVTRAPLAWLAAALFIGGCASLQRPTAVVPDWEARDARLLALTGWQARGRIAVKSEEGGGQGDIQWRQAGETSRIRVSGPFGAGAYEIRWDPLSLTVTSRKGEYTRDFTGADAAEQFLTEQLGWSFPAISTRYWLLGLPDPAFPAHATRAADGALLGLEQNGWRVTYERYAVSDGVPMPARITVQNGRARLRLVLDRWCLVVDCP